MCSSDLTLLCQLGVDASRYKFSKNLLDTSSAGFASYTFHNGFGWVNPSGYFGYTFNYDKVICRTDSSVALQNQIEREGFSFFQVAFEDFY